MESSVRLNFLEAINQEKRTVFGGFIDKANVQETLALTSNEADAIVADLVGHGYLYTEGFGNLKVKLTPTGAGYLARNNNRVKSQGIEDLSAAITPATMPNRSKVDISTAIVTEL